MNQYPKRLIEVDLPIKRISVHSGREKSMRSGQLSPVHIWWARRPLAACRAVTCAALWPDPVDPLTSDQFRQCARRSIIDWAEKVSRSSSPETFQYLEAVKKDPATLNDVMELRKGLLNFVADFSDPENATSDAFLHLSRALTLAAHESLGGESQKKPFVFDPFAGGGSIPFEALRVGADALGGDLNPVAVLLNKTVIEYIPKFGGELLEAVDFWAGWVRDHSEAELAGYYPGPNDGTTPIAYLWARTIRCEGPGCGAVLPMVTKLWLAQQGRRSVALKMKVDSESKEIAFDLVVDAKSNEVGEGIVKRGSAICPVCGYTTPAGNVRRQFSGRKGGANDARLLATVWTKPGHLGRIFRLPTASDLEAVHRASSELKRREEVHFGALSLVPDEPLPYLSGIFNIHLLDVKTWGDLFSDRQALALTVLASNIRESGAKMIEKGIEPELATAVQTVLALALDRSAENLTSICRWNPSGPKMQGTFGRQALPIVWDFCEAQPFGGSVGDWSSIIKNFRNAYETATYAAAPGMVIHQSATKQNLPDDSADAFITDPPYYDLVPYADLSDFFYVWLRRTVLLSHPQLLADDLTPKTLETVQLAERNPIYRYKTRENYEALMLAAMSESRRVLKPSGISVVFFAHKGTGAWESQLSAMIDAGWTITASWPLETEMATRLRAMDSAVLASSIELVCRPREREDGTLIDDSIGDWTDVVRELPTRIHQWMPRLAKEGIVGADAIFACLGPALEIFSRYSAVEKPNGDKVKLGEYLEHVWAGVAKEALDMIFAGADATGFEEDARLTAMWLWTLFSGNSTGEDAQPPEEEESDEDASSGTRGGSSSGFGLEYDAARKIAQGLGAHLEDLSSIVEVKGDKARLRPVGERARELFGYDDSSATDSKHKKKKAQAKLFTEMEEDEYESVFGVSGAPKSGESTLDRVHQTMLLFGAGRSEAVRRFLVDHGVGNDERFWRLANALSALYPTGTDEKRWVDGVLARKKGLGF